MKEIKPLRTKSDLQEKELGDWQKCSVQSVSRLSSARGESRKAAPFIHSEGTALTKGPIV